jgi:hypothetical protein
MRAKEDVIADIIKNRKKKGLCERKLKKLLRKHTLSELNTIHETIRRY